MLSKKKDRVSFFLSFHTKSCKLLTESWKSSRQCQNEECCDISTAFRNNCCASSGRFCNRKTRLIWPVHTVLMDWNRLVLTQWLFTYNFAVQLRQSTGSLKLHFVVSSDLMVVKGPYHFTVDSEQRVDHRLPVWKQAN